MKAVSLIKPWLVFCYFVLLFLSVFLPSGFLFSINVKTLVFLLTLGLVLAYCLVKNSFARSYLWLLVLTLASFAFLSLWLLVATLNPAADSSFAPSAFRAFAVTMALVYLTYFLYREGLFSFASFAKVVLFSNLGFSLAKIALSAAIFLGVVSFHEVYRFFQEALRYDLISMLIFERVVRLQFINDVLTPFSLFFVLFSDKLGLRLSGRFKAIFIAVSLLSIFLAYARYLWMATLAVFILYILAVAGRSLRRIIALTLTTFALSLAAFVFSAEVAFFIESRFLSRDVVVADNIRTLQLDALIQEASYYPLLGKGLGTFVEDHIRSVNEPYSYELQWVSFLLQFGSVGLVVLLAHAAAVIAPLLRRNLNPIRAAVLAAYALWLLSGFTNPYLISSTAGLLFSLFLLTALSLNDRAGPSAEPGQRAVS